MTNSQILSGLCLELTQVNKRINALQRGAQTPEIEARIVKLNELRNNIKISIADLRGAIACGADSPNPLAGWC